MSKKPFDHIENKIREAANGGEPAFSEQAWATMEALLDKEEGKKRPFIIWWKVALVVLFITAGLAGYWYTGQRAIDKKSPYLSALTKNKKIKNESPVEENKHDEVAVAVPQKRAAGDIVQNLPDTVMVQAAAIQKKNNSSNLISGENEKIKDKHRKDNRGKVQQIKGKTNGKIHINTSGNLADESEEFIVAAGTDASSTDKTDGQSTDNPAPKVKMEVAPKKIEVITTKLQDSTKLAAIEKDNKQPSTSLKKDEKKTKTTITSKFYLFAVAGTEASGVKILSFSNSTFKVRYGGGIGYQVSKRISVQGGFYAGTKKYVSGPNDYHIKPGTYLDRVQIDKIDAACMVYDIPVTVRYNFVQKASMIYYATAGISSFVMKKEAYDYFYTAYNYPHQKSYTYTGNKNLFSILSFSVGIEKKISRAFSLQAEPYLSIPISGVGDGAVKLYSAGVQLGVKYKPFFK